MKRLWNALLDWCVGLGSVISLEPWAYANYMVREASRTFEEYRNTVNAVMEDEVRLMLSWRGRDDA